LLRDENLLFLKGNKPVFSEEERLYIVKSIRYVHDAFLASGEGMLDFVPDMKRIKPDIFVVNYDGSTPEKEKLCRELGIEYVALERIPEPGLPARSSSEDSGTRVTCQVEFRHQEGYEVPIQVVPGWRLDGSAMGFEDLPRISCGGTDMGDYGF